MSRVESRNASSHDPSSKAPSTSSIGEEDLKTDLSSKPTDRSHHSMMLLRTDRGIELTQSKRAPAACFGTNTSKAARRSKLSPYNATTTTATRSNELCVCVSNLKSNPNASANFTNRVSVFVSPYPQEEAAAVGAGKRTDHPRVSASDTDLNCVGRLDTGASCHDFISKQLADQLIAMGAEVTPIVGRVCSAFTAVGRELSKCVNINYRFFNKNSNLFEIVNISPVILDDLSAPLIIGLQTIGQHDLLNKQLPELCQHSLTKKRPWASIPLSGVASANATESKQARQERLREKSANSKADSKSSELPPGLQPRRASLCGVRGGGGVPVDEGCELCVLRVSSGDFFGNGDDSEDDLENPPINITELLPSHTSGAAKVSKEELCELLISKIKLEGHESLQNRIRDKCRKFAHIFAESVKPQAAHVPPMTIEIDADALRHAGKGRKAAPRPQSREKLEELKQMVEELLRLGVIRVSTSDTTSQVLLVAKKGTTKLRFCIDYRAINEATRNPDKWPIPNIKTMLMRLGSKRPRFFGVMDLTSGYHQAPLDEASKKWTAFITAFGQFEWNRVAMGLTGAPSYFSRIMMTTVLGDILTKAVEVYLDDFIVFGSTEDEFLENLEQVFVRCAKANITLNPNKCRFGLQRIEYVGHTIDKDGIHFSREKIDSILDMPKPTSKGDMKIFLGMVNYFHSHIRHLATLEAPLTAMIGEEYTRGKRKQGMIWTAEAEASFEAIKVAIDECPKLWFRDDDLGPVYLQTDASQYGIGAYLFQIENDGITHRPIEILSKTLSKAQQRWAIPDKEAYAIFYAFKRWEHHLRDREFILQTDHLNLKYINFEGTAKVKRWKMLIQEFRFQIEFLEGHKNVVADSFSRNCAREVPEPVEDKLGDEFLQFLEESGLESGDISPDLDEHSKPDTEEELEFLEFLESTSELFAVFEIPTDTPIPDDIHEAISNVHNALKGHVGVDRTVKRLQTNGAAFKHMRDWVKRFIILCPFCQKMRYKRSKVETLPFTLSNTQRVMQVLNLDIIGPLEEDKFGYKHILVVVDTFSRWLMAYPMKTLETSEFVRQLIFHIGLFGAPAEFQTDGGSTLTASTVKEIIEMLKAGRKITVAYSHEENGLVERWNREIIRFLRALVYDSNSADDWSEMLPFAQRICNAEIVSSLGVSPATILFGAAIDLVRERILRSFSLNDDDASQ